MLKKKSLPLFLIVLIITITAFTPIVHATQEVIDSDTNSGTYLKVSAVFYKDIGEIDPNWDYYSIKVTTEDIYYKNDPMIGPLLVDVFVSFPTWGDEVPSNHEPKAGWRWSQTQLSYSFLGISYSVRRPKFGISYENYLSGGYRKTHWDVYGVSGPFCFGFVFLDYAEYSVGVRVPQGQKPYAYVWCQAVWYRNNIFFYTQVCWENIGGVSVDPPGAELPGPPDAPVLPEPPEYFLASKFQRPLAEE